MVIIIAAVAENNAIGKDNDLIWSLPDDMQFFKTTTLHQTVIMGRKNYESIPHAYRPLPKRKNIVITRNPNFQAPGCEVVGSLRKALDIAPQGDQYIIGGGEIYRLALKSDAADTMLLTEIKASFDADAYFPSFDPTNWSKEILLEHPADERHAYPFTIVKYLKIRP